MKLDNTYTEVAKDLQIIEDIFCEEEEDYETLYRQIDLTEEEFTEMKAGRLIPDKIQLENIYNFAYNHNLFLNEISWLEAEDEYNHGDISIKSHGAHIPITGDIILKKAPGSSNDFGDGFYLGEDISQAGTWVANDINSSIYIFTFDKSDLEEVRFDVNTDWMLAVALCRNKLDDYLNNSRLQLLKESIDNCDYVYAPIADNNLFDVIDAFINGEITDLQCLYAISATHLGYQVVLKNEKALSHIDLKKHLYLCSVEKSLFNRERDIESNTSMNKAKIAQERYKDSGKYIFEILAENSINENLQGLEDFSINDIKDDINYYLEDFIAENGLDINIVNIYFNGSRARGTARQDSDLDVVLAYSGDISEDTLFNIFHEEPLVLYGIEVDINPINIDKHDINDYMKKSLDYDKKILSNISESVGNRAALIEKLIELNDKLHIDSWYDKYSRNYITQVKDNEDNEVDYAYSGNRADRDADIKHFKDKYKDDIVEYYQSKKNKKKKQELPMTGLNPIIPDQGAGIDTFNKNMDAGGEAAGEISGGAGE